MEKALQMCIYSVTALVIVVVLIIMVSFSERHDKKIMDEKYCFVERVDGSFDHYVCGVI